MEYFNFDGHKVSRIFKGNWQLAGGHGEIPREQAIEDMFTHVEHGVNVFDVGDIYTGAEELVGEFLKEYRKRHGHAAAHRLKVHTKFVPDLAALEDLTEQDIRVVIERSLVRLGTSRLNLVQFHWWDFAKGDFVKAGLHLEKLRQEGLIETIGLTNFDCSHMQQLIDAGVRVKSNQIQFSLLDPRPLNGMLELAHKEGIAIFCYGVLAGGLLGAARPGQESQNRSHTKYQLVIGEVGEAYYRQVLAKLKALAEKHRTTTANIATAFVLQTHGVSAAILGPRNTKHIEELDGLGECKLLKSEYVELYRDMLRVRTDDDVYSYERDANGPHGRIMKYNLNGMRSQLATSG